MSGADVLQLLLLIVALAITVPLLGNYMARVYSGQKSRMEWLFRPVESFIYRISRIDSAGEQSWRSYAVSLLSFSTLAMFLLYAIERVQNHLLLNPTHAGAVSAPLAWNTAMSFLTNTNWQNYAGESSMSIFTQMVGLTVENFISAAVGISVAIALIRGLVRRRSSTLGSFWVDLTRSIVRLLLPLSFCAAIILIASGVIENIHGPTIVHTLAGGQQRLPSGSWGSQEAIKQLGTNGGGPSQANSANPFENPNGFSNIFEIWLMLAIAFSLPWTFGKMCGDRRQGGAVLAAMFVLWLGAGISAMAIEGAGNSTLSKKIEQASTSQVVGGNLSGKEVRFGSAMSALFDASATSTSTGASDSTNDSYTPLGGGVLLVNMMLGEVSPGGVGSGLYGMLLLALLSVFIAGLMVGRTPEYLGKKIQAAEMKLVAIYILIVPMFALGFAGVSIVLPHAKNSLRNSGAHGLTEVIYAFVSSANNNGSAFSGLHANTTYFNVTLGLAMGFGRFALIVLVLAIAGSLGRKQRIPVSAGTFPTGTPLFSLLLVGVTIVIVGLTYFPVLALGPLVEHFTAVSGR